LPLDEETKKKLISIAEKISKGTGIVSVVAYGSRVSGYWRKDSDYDMIVVLEMLRPSAKYSYGMEEGLYYSALLVDNKSFKKDCESGYLGEFVCGRLLNRFEVLTGQDYIKECEATYKRRVVVETVQELLEKYGPLSDQLIFNARYVLFNKLKKRAFLYPPVAYSYIKTYSGPSGEENAEFATGEIERQMQMLCSEGMLLRVEKGYMLSSRAEKLVKSYPLASSFRLAKLGVRQYVTHGLAGRVGVDVAFKELFSKIGRVKEKPEPPAELVDPRKDLALSEGKLVFGSDWLDALAQDIGAKDFKHEAESIGEFFATTTIHKLIFDGKVFTFVSKRYQDIWSLKWMVASLVALTARTFETRPMHRLANEYKGFLHLRMLGIRTPKVYVVAPEEKVMAREHLEGYSLEDMIREKGSDPVILSYVAKFASALGKLHQTGMSMGDTKPTNVICREEDIAIIDLEQAEENGDPSWDVAEFIYYTSTLVQEEDVWKLADSFVKGYLQHGDPRVLVNASAQKYLLPFQALVQPNSLTAARNRLLELR
jgi:tRNA A-37 threonylcarbamoyl transferase component Bud32/predicted nucleotidyltransferase